MPSFYNYAPRELTSIPFNLRRSQLYPVNPPTVRQGIEQYAAGEPEVAGYMPQRMGFTRWKSGPAAKTFGASAVSALQASDIYSQQVGDLVGATGEAGTGIYTPTMAAYDFNRLPQPMDNWYADPTPVARNLLNRPVAQAANLNQYAYEGQQIPQPGYTGITTPSLLQTARPDPTTPLGKLAGLARTGGLGSTPNNTASNTWYLVYATLSVAGAALGGYHGYKRNNSVGWALGWSLLGSLFPIIVLPIAFAQGFGKRKRGR
jgi:hypothetical protein